MDTFYLGLPTVVFGAIVGLAGYQLYRVLLPIWGFIAGFVWGAHIVDLALGESFLSTLNGWGVGIVVGIVGAILAYTFYRAAVAILVGLIGFYIVYAVMLQLGAQEGALATLVSLLTAATVGLVATYFYIPKTILIVLTALAGAAAVLGGGLVMSGQITPNSLGSSVVGDIINDSALWLIAGITLAVLGVASQMLMDRNLRQEWEDDYALSDRTMMGAIGGEVEREQINYNRFEDDEVETVNHIRRRNLSQGDDSS